MDRQAIAREVRRRQVQESLDFEREREQTLTEQVELVVTENEGSKVDALAFARMTPEDVEIVNTELNPLPYDPEDPGTFLERDDLIDLDQELVDPHEEEIARLTEELEACRRRQRAFQAYLEALGT